ncbi:HAD-IA family hydrolase [Streptococcus suis]
MRRVASLFGDWPEAIIWTCLEGRMGQIHVDNTQSPQSALALYGRQSFFGFLAGKPNVDLLKMCEGKDIILVPQNQSWSDLIEGTYGDRIRSFTRYATKKDTSFDLGHLQKLIDALSEEFDLKVIDRNLYDACLVEDWSRDLAGIQETYEQFGLPFDREEVRKYILRYSVKDLLVRDADKYGLDSDELNRVRATSLKEKNTQIPLMAGAAEILDWTAQQGIQNFVYTHKSDNAFQVLEDLGVRHHFTEILTSDSGFARKPSPEALLFLIEKYGLDQENTYYIGDRLLDVETAVNAGIHSINLQIDGVEKTWKIVSLLDIKQILTDEYKQKQT